MAVLEKSSSAECLFFGVKWTFRLTSTAPQKFHDEIYRHNLFDIF
jgi:hypothetical protein